MCASHFKFVRKYAPFWIRNTWISEFFRLFYIISIQTIYANQKLHTLSRFITLRAISNLFSSFLIQPTVERKLGSVSAVNVLMYIHIYSKDIPNVKEWWHIEVHKWGNDSCSSFHFIPFHLNLFRHGSLSIYIYIVFHRAVKLFTKIVKDIL